MLCGFLLPLLLSTIQEPRSTASLEAKPFLRIDGEDVSVDEFGRWLLDVEGEHQVEEFARKSWAVDREATRLGIAIEDAEIDREVERQIRERVWGAFRGRREEWLAELDRTGRTEDGIRRQRSVELRPELQARAIASLDRVVPEHLIRREWELRHGRGGHRYDLRLMRFRVDVQSRPDMPREEWEAGRAAATEAARRKALVARERVLHGEDFGLVASRESDDPDTRDHRGVPSGGFRHVGWPGSFLDALDRLAPGDISQPIFARGGWWLVHLRSVEVTPLEDVRLGIEADLVARGPEPYEVGLVLDRVAEGMQVEVLPSLFDLPVGQEWPGALEPVIRLDGEPVTRGEYVRWLFDAIGESSVGSFVEEWLVSRRARGAGIEVGEAETAERTRAYVSALVEEGYHGNREAWIAYLELGGRSEAAFVRRIARRLKVDLLTEKLFVRERVIHPQAVRSRFLDAYGADGIRREVRVILCAIRNPDPPAGLSRVELQSLMEGASTAARRRAEALVERLRAGEDFAALARAASDDPRTRDQGGAMPGPFRPDRWPEAIARAVFSLKPSGITEPLLYGNAWFVFQLASERRVTFEEVHDELEREIRASRPTSIEVAGYRNELAKRARVERRPVSGR